MLLTTSTTFDARQQNSAQQQQNMATPEGSGPLPGTSTGSGPPPEAVNRKTLTSPPQGAAVTTEGENVTILHIVGLLPAPVADVEKSYIQHHGMIKGSKN